MIKLITIILYLFFSIFSCESGSNKLQKSVMTERLNRETLELNTFKSYPPEIESDCFSASFLNQVDRQNSNYLLYFGTEYHEEKTDAIVYLIINNKPEILRFDKAIDTSLKHLSYSNSIYVIELITISRKQTGYESFEEKEVVKIFKQKKLMIEIEVINITAC